MSLFIPVNLVPRIVLKFFVNITGLPGHRNERKKCFGNYKNILFLYFNYKIIEQEMNKLE